MKEKEQKKTFDWKTPEELDPNDPFALPEDLKKKEVLSLPIPTFHLSEKEKNKVQKELLKETEERCIKLHENLTFFTQEHIDPSEAAQYSLEEAQTIIREKSRLNKEQIDAALRSRKDIFIQALAGTGKTSLLSASISYLLAIGHNPMEIAISSHTVAAAEEIKNRILPTLETLYPETKKAMGDLRPNTGTIHAIAYREMIYHKHPKSRWTILDESQQFRIWKEANLFAFPSRNSLINEKTENEVMGEEMRIFDRVRGYDIPEKEIGKVVKLVSNSEDLPRVADFYQRIKQERKLLDYTDLLREWAPIIIHPGYKNKWDYFFVDEFQDTNPLQKFLLKLLKYSGANLVVCGDNRQSINSFTGSDPTSHEEFFKGFGIQEAWLQTNYRCSKEIIGLANEVIASMMPPEKGRLKPHEKAPKGDHVKIVFTKNKWEKKTFLPPKELEIQRKKECHTSCTEAVSLYEELTKIIEGEKPSVAILYRTNAQGSILEEAITSINTNRQRRGLEPIKYSRKDYRKTALRNKTEREILNILNTWCAPENTNWESLLLSQYFHGIGEVTARNIQKKADRHKPRTIEDADKLFQRELSKRNAITIGEFFLAWQSITSELTAGEEPNLETTCKALTTWIEKVAEKKDYEEGSKKESEEAQRRSYETGIIERLLQKGNNGLKLSAAIAEISDENEKTAQAQNNANKALAFTSENKKQEKEEGIILCTIHLAKGREYDGVVIHQVSERSLPHFNSMRFYDNPNNRREKGFRKFASFPSLQQEEINYECPDETLPKIWRVGIRTTAPKNSVEAWEDHNNPLEEEKRLLYVAITRAKLKLVITSNDHDYAFLPKTIWEKLKQGKSFS